MGEWETFARAALLNFLAARMLLRPSALLEAVLTQKDRTKFPPSSESSGAVFLARHPSHQLARPRCPWPWAPGLGVRFGDWGGWIWGGQSLPEEMSRSEPISGSPLIGPRSGPWMIRRAKCLRTMLWALGVFGVRAITRAPEVVWGSCESL